MIRVTYAAIVPTERRRPSERIPRDMVTLFLRYQTGYPVRVAQDNDDDWGDAA